MNHLYAGEPNVNKKCAVKYEKKKMKMWKVKLIWVISMPLLESWLKMYAKGGLR